MAAKALSPDPAGRYADVRDFQRDLSDCLTHAESIAVTRRARQALDRLQAELLPAEAPPSSDRLRDLSKDDASLAYGRLSECIGGFRQALALWPDHQDARQGLADALSLHVRLAIRQDDLTLARAQLRLLNEPGLPPTGPGPDRLAARIAERQTRLLRSARRVRLWRTAASVFGVLSLGGLAAIAALSFRQRTLAIRNEQDMFVASVAGCARSVGQFMLGNGGEETRCGPSLPIRHFGEPGPQGLDGRQAQLVEHDAEARFVDMMSVGHAPSPAGAVPIRAS